MTHTPDPPEHTVALNNYLQRNGLVAHLSWQEMWTGARHRQEWTANCVIKDEVLGAGKGLTKSAAREQAAGIALRALRNRGEPSSEVMEASVA
ncbi:uncharacterized protein BXZ73DRAFT_96494 [Epithele typhae]|uniref:uncharacterized protein n=1 Tax=Epithele typhae TaxID=378194 RepID=UPI0020072D0F|nr:uncharacterized protein BXZ73DRAFT_96494 [Epithele typhae]KAH9943981.1 hypothetical protein BXZ73DRAFT_96494 [Epithele typhae]